MPRHPLVSLIVVVALVADAPFARAEMPHSVCRYLGFGWSDGYHSHAGGPTNYHTTHYLPTPAPSGLPWWKIPAKDTEELPRPFNPSSATSRSYGSSGPSLFRQPGEGSSIIAAGPATAAPR